LDFKDYYKILGVSPDADIKNIKKVYQKLAKKYHPDLNPGNKEAEEKFKEINEAYHAISDPVKRKKYDDLRGSYLQWQKRGGSGKNFDWSAWQHNPESGNYTRTMTPEEFESIFGGASGLGEGFSGFSDFFATIFGMDLDFDSPYASPAEDYYEAFRQPRAGRDIKGEISVTLEEVYHGAKKLIAIGGKKIEASIPKGIQDGNKIRLAGQGREGSRGGPKGDLLLTVKIQPHARYARRGNDLYTDLEIDFYTAVLGGEAKINTPAGEMMLKIPSQTQAGKSFRLKGKGMPILNQAGKFGDLYAKISIILPNDLTEKEISVLEELYKQRQSKK
jgi:curved DNA-binding protein